MRLGHLRSVGVEHRVEGSVAGAHREALAVQNLGLAQVELLAQLHAPLQRVIALHLWGNRGAVILCTRGQPSPSDALWADQGEQCDTASKTRHAG